MKIKNIKNSKESKEQHETLELNVELKPLVHNLVGRHFHTVETPTAIALAPPNRILLGLPTRCVQVKDLLKNKLLFSFRTVHQTTKLIHCLNGDYIAAIEIKHSANNTKIAYVRIYVNWYQQCGEEKTFSTTNVRVAGWNFCTKARGFEIIEMLGSMPDNIECCQISGNLLIQSEKRLTIYEFQTKRLGVTALRLIDFAKAPFHVKLSFVPFKMAICENFISCLSEDRIEIFKIEKKKRGGYFKLLEDYEDYKKLFEENANHEDVHLSRVTNQRNPIFEHCPGSYYDASLNCQIEPEDTHGLVNCMQVKIQDPFEFKCLVLKPLYAQKDLDVENSRNAFPKSKFRERLGAVTCFVSTSQQGFLFQLNNLEDTCECISVYLFPEPVHDVVLGSSFLHALDKNGLKSYTVKIGHKLFNILEETALDVSLDDSIMLLSHYDVSGFVKLLECDRGLILLEDNEFLTDWVNLNWKLLHLELPAPKAILSDAVKTALLPQGYLQLMKKVHTMLRLSTRLTNWILDEDNLVRVAPSDCDLIETYQKLCALLGDHFILKPNYELSVPYYKMGSIPPYEVLQRFKRLQAQNDEGLVNYLTVVLSEEEMEDNHDFLQKVESVFEKHRHVEVAPLVLKNAVLRKSTGKLADILLGQSFNDTKKETERLLALILLYFQNGKGVHAKKAVRSLMDNQVLHQILQENWNILFSSSGLFSKLCLTLLVFKYKMVVKVLTFVMINEKAYLNTVIHALQEFDKTTEIKVSTTQKTFELYLKTLIGKKKKEDVITMLSEDSVFLRAATKRLVKSYWDELKTLNGNKFEKILPETENNFLLEDLRFKYLNSMPSLRNKNSDLILKKMEALFCSPLVLLLDADAFVEVNNYPSLKSIMLNPEERLLYLVKTCPECLLQYGKDHFGETRQWKVLISQLWKTSLNPNDDCKSSSQFYKNLLVKILSYLKRNLSLDEFKDLLSDENGENLDRYDAYLTLCYGKQTQEFIHETDPSPKPYHHPRLF